MNAFDVVAVVVEVDLFAYLQEDHHVDLLLARVVMYCFLLDWDLHHVVVVDHVVYDDLDYHYYNSLKSLMMNRNIDA